MDVKEILEKNNQMLMVQLEQANKRNEQSEKLNKQLQHEVSYLTELIKEMNRRMFGRSKESSSETIDGQLSLFEEESIPAAHEELVESTEVVAHRRKKKGAKAAILASLPGVNVEHELSESERVCDHCGGSMVDMGSKEIRIEAEFLQAKIQKLIHRQHSYVCKDCERHGETSIKKATVPKALIPNSLGSASVVTETIIQKFQQKVPAYRQEKFWANHQLPISRDNICNWHIIASQQVLQPLFTLLQKELVKQEVLHADETSYTVIQSEKAKTYYWMFCSGNFEERQIVLYHHAESRGHEIPEKFLEGYSGYLHCDGWGAYPLVPDITLMACGAHIRRKFYEALGNKKQPNKTSPAYKGLKFWDRMFKVELTFREKKLSPSDRFKQRQLLLKPILDDFYSWIGELDALNKSKLALAVEYSAKQRENVYNIIEDGRLELSNNKAERMIKELVMCRKNQLFSTSLAGAYSTGVILSIMKTAELNGLDIQKYLNYLFVEIPNLPVMTEEFLREYLPWSKKVIENCRKK